jgi:hypothetical protein
MPYSINRGSIQRVRSAGRDLLAQAQRQASPYLQQAQQQSSGLFKGGYSYDEAKAQAAALQSNLTKQYGQAYEQAYGQGRQAYEQASGQGRGLYKQVYNKATDAIGTAGDYGVVGYRRASRELGKLSGGGSRRRSRSKRRRSRSSCRRRSGSKRRSGCYRRKSRSRSKRRSGSRRRSRSTMKGGCGSALRGGCGGALRGGMICTASSYLPGPRYTGGLSVRNPFSSKSSKKVEEVPVVADPNIDSIKKDMRDQMQKLIKLEVDKQEILLQKIKDAKAALEKDQLKKTEQDKAIDEEITKKDAQVKQLETLATELKEAQNNFKSMMEKFGGDALLP